MKRFRAAQQSGEYVEYVFGPNERSVTEPPETPVTKTITTTSTGILPSASTESTSTEHTSDSSEEDNSDVGSSEDEDNPPLGYKAVTFNEAIQYFLDNPRVGTRMPTTHEIQAYRDSNRQTLKRKRAGELEEVEEEEAEDDDEFEGFED